MEQVSWPHDPTGDRTCKLQDLSCNMQRRNIHRKCFVACSVVVASPCTSAKSNRETLLTIRKQAHRPRSKTLAEHSVQRIGKARAFTLTTLLFAQSASSCDAPLPLDSYAEPRGGTAAALVSAGCASAERTVWADGSCSAVMADSSHRRERPAGLGTCSDATRNMQ